MIVIRGAMNIRPENKGRFLELLLQEANEVRRLEGWMNFNIFEDARSKKSLFLYEEWGSLESFNAYRTSAAFKETGQQLFPLLGGKPDSAYYLAEGFS
jgi:quinol monooxygenase YgiN